jgi:hypothetical protein
MTENRGVSSVSGPVPPCRDRIRSLCHRGTRCKSITFFGLAVLELAGKAQVVGERAGTSRITIRRGRSKGVGEPRPYLLVIARPSHLPRRVQVIRLDLVHGHAGSAWP